MGCWRTCSAGTTTAWYARSEKTRVQMVVCTTITWFCLLSAGVPLCWRALLCHWSWTKRLVRKYFIISQHQLFRLWAHFSHHCVSGRGPFSRGQGATGSRAWTALVIIASASAGRGAGWWWRTPSWCTWTGTTDASTLCCSLTRSSKWKWAVPTQTPDMECASRTSLGRSADSTHSSCSILGLLWLGSSISCPGVWSSNAAATDKLIGGVMRSIDWQKPVTFWKNSASMALLLHGRTRSLNGQNLPDGTGVFRFCSCGFTCGCCLKVCEWARLLCRPGWCSWTS